MSRRPCHLTNKRGNENLSAIVVVGVFLLGSVTLEER